MHGETVQKKIFINLIFIFYVFLSGLNENVRI